MGRPGIDPPTPEEEREAIDWADKTSARIPALREHYLYNLDFAEGFQLHLAMVEFEVWASKEYARDRHSKELAEFIRLLDSAAASQNGYLTNAVAVSFIEVLWDSWMILDLGPAATAIAQSMYPKIFRTGRPLKPLT